MNYYPILIFLHAIGAVAMFAAGGIDVVAHARFRRARTVADVRTWMDVIRIPARLGPASLVVLLATGIWMMVAVWGMKAWIMTGFVGLLAIGALGGAVTGGAMRRLVPLLDGESGPELSPAFRSRQLSSVLTLAMNLRLTIGIGVLALMTMKPALLGSLIIMAVALVAGWVGGMMPARTKA